MNQIKEFQIFGMKILPKRKERKSEKDYGRCKRRDVFNKLLDCLKRHRRKIYKKTKKERKKKGDLEKIKFSVEHIFPTKGLVQIC